MKPLLVSWRIGVLGRRGRAPHRAGALPSCPRVPGGTSRRTITLLHLSERPQSHAERLPHVTLLGQTLQLGVVVAASFPNCRHDHASAGGARARSSPPAGTPRAPARPPRGHTRMPARPRGAALRTAHQTPARLSLATRAGEPCASARGWRALHPAHGCTPWSAVSCGRQPSRHRRLPTSDRQPSAGRHNGTFCRIRTW